MMALHNLRTGRLGLPVAAIVAALLQTACLRGGSSATFERTLHVTGPVRLEVTTGSGAIVIRSGAAGEVRIRGEVRARGYGLDSAMRRAQEIASSPPIDQSGNLIRLGGRRGESPFGAVAISYTVETPGDTEASAKDGSGSVEITGLRDPVTVTLGSGDARMDDLGDNVTITLGSGSIRVSRVHGSVTFQSGSGRLSFNDVREDIRGTAGSGNIDVDRAQGRVNVRTGSGPIRVSGAAEDVRASTGSGTIEVLGNPGNDAFWDIGTGSGSIELSIPANASFALSARTGSGNMTVDMPIQIEEQSRRFLRARVGEGKAHVNLETRSGNIHIRQRGTGGESGTTR
jgi:putative adhesin